MVHMVRSFEDARKLGSRIVTVDAPARLHMGFLDLNGDLGRHFGSLGLALDRPRTRVSVVGSASVVVEGPCADIALEYARTFMNKLGLTGGVQIDLDQTIPPHAGLGSGTQLALAVGMGIARLYGLEITSAEIGRVLGRGARSGIGIGAFEQGGFLIDGGRSREDIPPPLICRLRVPDQWRIVLVLDPDRQGVHGDEEQYAFATLPQFSAAESGKLCRLVLMKILPALAQSDIVGFGQGISELQRRVGNHFAARQGGRFSSDEVEAALRWMSRNGAAGVGQSSWGPTGFAVCESERVASDLIARSRESRGNSSRLQFVLSKPRNEAGSVHIDTIEEPAAEGRRRRFDRA
jgi:beta-RFAP synthase